MDRLTLRFKPARMSKQISTEVCIPNFTNLEKFSITETPKEVSVTKLKLRTVMVPNILEIAWEIPELYKQTSIEETFQPAQEESEISVNAERPLALNPSPKEVISISVNGKPSGAHPTKWIFALSYHTSTESEGQWKLSLRRETDARDSVIIQLELKILNPEGNEFWKQSVGPLRLNQAQTDCQHLQKPLTNFQFAASEQQKPQIQSQSDNNEAIAWCIGKALDIHKILVDGTLTIYINLKQLDRQSHNVKDVTEPEIEFRDKVAMDMKALMISGDDTDFKIIVRKDSITMKEFKVHKCILRARSTVFKTKLAENPVNANGYIAIENVEPDTVQALLTFIYSGTVDLRLEKLTQNKILLEIFVEAAKLKLNELVESIGNRLIDLCTPTNAMSLLRLAKENNLQPAVNQIRNYIQENIKEII